MRLETLQTVVPSRATNSCVGCCRKNYFQLMCLPPTTLQDKITSSPSSIGPMVVLFIARPQRSMISMEPGKTEKQKERTASAGNISWADVVIMIRFVVSSASWAIEFFLLETFPHPWWERRRQKGSRPCAKSAKRVENIFTSLILMWKPFCWFCHQTIYRNHEELFFICKIMRD